MRRRSIVVRDYDGDYYIINRDMITTVEGSTWNRKDYPTHVRVNIETLGEDGGGGTDLYPIDESDETLRRIHDGVVAFGRALIENEPDEVIQEAISRLMSLTDTKNPKNGNVIL